MTGRTFAPRSLIIPVIIVAGMAVVATLGFRGVFPDWSFIPAAVVGALGATLVTLGGRWARLSVSETILVSIVAFVALGAVAAEGIPTPAAFRTFFDGVVGGWAGVLSSTPPADVTAEFRVLPFTVAWFAAMVGGEILRSSRTPGLAALGPVAALGLSLLVTLEDRGVALAQGAVMVVGSLLLAHLQQRRRNLHTELFEDVTIQHPRRGIGIVSAFASIAAIAAISPVIGPRLPLAGANERFDLREYQTPPFDPLRQPSPLVQIKAALQEEHADTVLFTVTSDEQIGRFPLAVLDHYNGEFWAVANESVDAAGDFRPVDTNFPGPRGATIEGRDRVLATIEIKDFDKLARGEFAPVWMPTLGWPVTLTSEEPLDLRFNLDTGTLALAPDGPREGLRYDLVAAVPPALEQLNLRSASITQIEPFDLAAPQLLRLAGNLLEGTDRGWEQIEAIRVTFVDQGFYDSRDQSVTGRSGHRLARLVEFVDDPERIAGFEEQYAATAALLARSEGIPTRVVVGYLIEPDALSDRWEGAELDVVAEDMSAWIEVNFDGIGWIPFDVTPPRNREPEDTSAGRSEREVAVPNPPPEPPPPVLPPPLDRELDLEEDEEEEAEDDDDEEVVDETGFPVRAVALGAAASSPFLLLVGGSVAVVLLKRRRTNRRRNANEPFRRIAGAWHEVVDRFEELGARSRRTATTHEFARGLHAAQLIDEEDRLVLLALAEDTDLAAYHPHPPTDDYAMSAWEKTDLLLQRVTQRQRPLQRLRHRLDPRPLFRKDSLMTIEDSNA